MAIHTLRTLSVLALGTSLVTAMAQSCAAQELSLNDERLSTLEEPLATEWGDVTIALGGLLDTRLTLGSGGGDADGADFVGNFELSASTQWSNRWRLGIEYFGQYATDGSPESERDGAYADKAALSLGGAWGTALGGDVSSVVREQTRRLRGAGNAFLAFDDFLGERTGRGVGYVGRFGPWVIGAVVDEDGGVDAGAMFQRPAGIRDVRLTLRAAGGTYLASDGSGRFDARGVGVVGELIHGSTSFDAGVGHERLALGAREADRWYVSSGVRTKTGVLSVSLEGHFGRIEGEDEVSAALGLQYDLARGLSANLGLNHASARVDLGGTGLVDTRDTEAVLSLRYSY